MRNRIAPACAGKTTPVSVARSAKGSPPRVRGKLVIYLNGVDLPRITPACAGKTFHHVHDFDQAEDHPRVCGENADRKNRLAGTIGSPPRVRGKLHIILFVS